MQFDLVSPGPSGRFDWIMGGASRGSDDSFDEDLAQYAEAAVIPTRGAIVPEWLLVVPRRPCLSFADLAAPVRARLLTIAEQVARRVSAVAGASIIFEHGPGRRASPTGCGVDQAHLHVVGGSRDLLKRVIDGARDARWLPVDHADPWTAVSPGSDYLMVRDEWQAVQALVATPTSQRLRQAVADALGRGCEWDYRSHPNALNARRTKEMFRGAFADAS